METGKSNVKRLPARRAFTLVELLVVVGLIVLMMAMAVPLFGLIRGNRSVDAAQNQVSAMIAMARSKAIELRRPAGVMFFRDPGSNRIMMAQVARDVNGADFDMDLVADQDTQMMQSGISIAFHVPVSSWSQGTIYFPGSEVIFQGKYYAFAPANLRPLAATLSNRPTGPESQWVAVSDSVEGQYWSTFIGDRDKNGDLVVPVVAMIVFDANGELIIAPTAIMPQSKAAGIMGGFGKGTTNQGNVQIRSYWYSNASYVLYDDVAARSRGGQSIYRWLDENATQFVINRYSGQSMRGE